MNEQAVTSDGSSHQALQHAKLELLQNLIGICPPISIMQDLLIAGLVIQSPPVRMLKLNAERRQMQSGQRPPQHLQLLIESSLISPQQKSSFSLRSNLFFFL